MRISDWSTDVCSSDLPHATLPARRRPIALGRLRLISTVLATKRLVIQLAAIRAFVVGRFVVTLRPASGVDQGQQARSFLPIFKVHPHFGGIAELFEVHARGWPDPGSDAVLPSDAVCPPFRIADDGAGRPFGVTR